MKLEKEELEFKFIYRWLRAFFKLERSWTYQESGRNHRNTVLRVAALSAPCSQQRYSTSTVDDLSRNKYRFKIYFSVIDRVNILREAEHLRTTIYRKDAISSYKNRLSQKFCINSKATTRLWRRCDSGSSRSGTWSFATTSTCENSTRKSDKQSAINCSTSRPSVAAMSMAIPSNKKKTFFCKNILIRQMFSTLN